MGQLARSLSRGVPCRAPVSFEFKVLAVGATGSLRPVRVVVVVVVDVVVVIILPIILD